MNKKVFVSGCFDIIHNGHIEFLREASKYGDLYVGLGSDKTIEELKGHISYLPEDERLEVIKSIKYVKDAFINSGIGKIDFKNEIEQLRPDYFIVNSDGDSQEKQLLCSKLGIKYVILKDFSIENKINNSSEIKNKLIPYRIDLCGGWLDQPQVSSIYPGCVITLSIQPTYNFKERCGMATSTRKKLKEYFPNGLPQISPEKMSKLSYIIENNYIDNGVGGAQDSIGICYPGLTKHFYSGDKFPREIESIKDKKIYEFLENHIGLIETSPRKDDYNPYHNADFNIEYIKHLSENCDKCWDSIIECNLDKFAKCITNNFNIQKQIFPTMETEEYYNTLKKYNILGSKYVGAGGGGYILGIFKELPDDIIKIKINQ